MPDPGIIRELIGAVEVVTITGEVDYSTAADVQRVVSDEGRTGDVVVDLTGVTFIDSTGLRALVSAREALAAKERDLGLVVGETVARLLSLTALDRDFTIHPSLDEALTASR